jgi:3-dehydroquinate synthase
VAAGMVLASRLSVLRGTLDAEVVDQLTAFNQAVGLPVAPPAGITAQAMLEAMGSDKKSERRKSSLYCAPSAG